ncbi:MAG TPA: DUF6526 family protein [Terriglobales bacterium]|nr:DUF6526 family protein [Terriglobales bacterium]
MAEQNYANHVKWVPAFHFFVVPVLLLNLGEATYRIIHWGFSFERLVGVLTATALVVLMFLARIFALKVQDRVIRLEERLRMERLLPADLKPRIGEFRPGQLVALRFASDEELPELARKVLNEKIQGTKAIKLLVKYWRSDYLRA